MKKILTVQDISCVGKCSGTVALPIISATKNEACLIPSALLSTHTAFKDFTFLDLSDEIIKIADHFDKLNISFDAIYTGYLGSKKQINIINTLIKKFKRETTLSIVDPVMADHGKFYTGFDKDFSKSMKDLCINTDVVLPNLTEACFLLDIDYIEKDYSKDYIKDILMKLKGLNIRYPILTGVSFSDDKIGVMAYNSDTNTFFEYYNKKIDFSLHGTGDIFSSCFAGSLVRGYSLEEAISIAVDFVCEVMKETINDKDKRWYGASFEPALKYLIERIN